MKSTIIIHGSPDKEEYYDVTQPSPSNHHWIPWLQKELTLKDEISFALEMPKPYDPIYLEWVKVVENCKIDKETTLIGHSCGGGFLLRYLSENKNIIPNKVILIAPWVDPEKELSTNFFEFEIDSELTQRTELHMFTSSDDFEGCLKSFDIIRNGLPSIHLHEFENKEHFCMKDFLELLQIL